MEPVTHLLTGAVLSRAGFNRKAAYATLAMTVAAEVPDLDILWGFKGPVAAFEHHRGWTHTLIGLPIEAAIVTGAIWLGHRLLGRWRKPTSTHATRPEAAPIHWPRLYLLSLIALLSHLLLDWTNNYGLRPFFPFNPRWYAGSFVFIFEPVMFILLLTALVAPALFGLVSSEVGARRSAYRGRGWAIAALAGVVVLWCWRAFEHSKAIELARSADMNGATIVRVTANPYPINPYRWQTITETPLLYQISTVNTFTDDVISSPQAGVFYKPATTLAALVAKRSWLGRIYLDWSQYPLVTESGTTPDGLTTVTFRDLRFVYSASPLPGRDTTPDRTPLSGAVIVNDDRRVDHMEMDGHIQP